MVDFAIEREERTTNAHEVEREAVARPRLQAPKPARRVDRMQRQPTRIGTGEAAPKYSRPLLTATMGERAAAAFRLQPEVGALLKIHRAEPGTIVAEKLHFTGIEGKTGYNPSAVFKLGKGAEATPTIAVRVESKDSEDDSKIVFFQRQGADWHPGVDLSRELALQDPYVTKIDGQHIVGGVRVTRKPGGGHEWDQAFYRSTDGLKTFEKEIDNHGNQVLKPVFVGPKGMKDVRPRQLRDGRIAVFSRPQGDLAKSLGAPGPHGSVGFTIFNSLAEMTADGVAQAPLLKVQFPADQWWGVNDFRELDDGTLQVFGHVARRDAAPAPGAGDPRDYYMLQFHLDPKSGQVSQMKIIAERADFGPLGESKRPELVNVSFTGGLGGGVISAGAGDAEAYLLKIKPAR